MAIVYDFFTNIDRRSVKVENNLYHVDGAHYSGAKAPRAEKNDLFHGTTVANLAHAVYYNSHVAGYTDGYGLLIRNIDTPASSRSRLGICTLRSHPLTDTATYRPPPYRHRHLPTLPP